MMVAMAEHPPILLCDTVVTDDVGPKTLRLPLPARYGPGLLVRDDAARCWRFEPDGPMPYVEPTDADIVALMKMRGNGTREQPKMMGAPVNLAWRGVGILEQDAQAAWDRFHAQPAAKE